MFNSINFNILTKKCKNAILKIKSGDLYLYCHSKEKMDDELLKTVEEFLENIKKDVEADNTGEYNVSKDIVADEHLKKIKTAIENQTKNIIKRLKNEIEYFDVRANYEAINTEIRYIKSRIDWFRLHLQILFNTTLMTKNINNDKYILLYDFLLSCQMLKDSLKKTENDIKKVAEKDIRMQIELEFVEKVFGEFKTTKVVRRKKGKICEHVNKSVEDLEEERNQRFAVINKYHKEKKISNEELIIYIISLRRIYARSIDNQLMNDLKDKKISIRKNKSLINKIIEMFKLKNSKINIEEDFPDAEKMTAEDAGKALEKVYALIEQKKSHPEIKAELVELYKTKVAVFKNNL